MVEKNTDYDVIIAGGGPAGLSSLLWCAELGLTAILIEKEPEFGGQLLHTHNSIKNYLGIEAVNGRELRDIFLRQIEKAKIKRLTGAEIVEADLTQKSVTLADGTKYSSRAIIIATGVRRRKLIVPGEEELRGRGILESG
ncbi:MAG: NAD(P)/FAD-dependent oxidoreductase, partial [Pyrinomonadaceae bacterium]